MLQKSYTTFKLYIKLPNALLSLMPCIDYFSDLCGRRQLKMRLKDKKKILHALNTV